MSNPFNSRHSARRLALLRRRAGEMRCAGTASEQRLWQCLVNSKLGVPFRRQVVIAGRIADFVAPSLRLVVEVDGVSHASRRAADARRDEKLQRLGYRVLRLDAQLVIHDLPAAVARVRDALWRA